MSYTITIKYDASAVTVQGADGAKVPTICDIFTPGSCAADMEAFEGTYYDTNTHGDMGEAMALEDYMSAQVTHPGLVAALRKAMRDGSYTYETDVPMADAFIEEAIAVMAPYGFSSVDAEGGEENE